ncbi:MAG: hypothetical protein M3457_00300 [Chloroflexota bacterium]|nr:hypothetical protein [Chloroflexota bacterium]
MVIIQHNALLQSTDGTRLLAELRDVAPTPATSIAIATRLRKTYPTDLVIATMEMHDLRVRARAKFSQADDLWFTRDGLEQARPESIAARRSPRPPNHSPERQLKRPPTRATRTPEHRAGPLRRDQGRGVSG